MSFAGFVVLTSYYDFSIRSASRWLQADIAVTSTVYFKWYCGLGILIFNVLYKHQYFRTLQKQYALQMFVYLYFTYTLTATASYNFPVSFFCIMLPYSRWPLSTAGLFVWWFFDSFVLL